MSEAKAAATGSNNRVSGASSKRGSATAATSTSASASSTSSRRASGASSKKGSAAAATTHDDPGPMYLFGIDDHKDDGQHLSDCGIAETDRNGELDEDGVERKTARERNERLLSKLPDDVLVAALMSKLPRKTTPLGRDAHQFSYRSLPRNVRLAVYLESCATDEDLVDLSGCPPLTRTWMLKLIKNNRGLASVVQMSKSDFLQLGEDFKERYWSLLQRPGNYYKDDDALTDDATFFNLMATTPFLEYLEEERLPHICNSFNVKAVLILLITGHPVANCVVLDRKGKPMRGLTLSSRFQS